MGFLDDLLGDDHNDMAKRIVAAEETAREMERTGGRQHDGSWGAPKKDDAPQDVATKTTTQTIMENEEDKTVSSRFRFVEISNTGNLEQLLLESQSKDYDIFLYIEGEVVHSHDWQWFADRSDLLDDISAFTENGVHKLHMTDFDFTNSIIVEIRPNGSVTFDNMVAKLEVEQ